MSDHHQTSEQLTDSKEQKFIVAKRLSHLLLGAFEVGVGVVTIGAWLTHFNVGFIACGAVMALGGLAEVIKETSWINRMLDGREEDDMRPAALNAVGNFVVAAAEVALSISSFATGNAFGIASTILPAVVRVFDMANDLTEVAKESGELTSEV